MHHTSTLPRLQHNIYHNNKPNLMGMPYLKRTTMSFLQALLLLPFLSFCNADSLSHYCNQATNISSNSQVSTNIDKLLSELVAKTPITGYIASSYGKNQDKIYGLAQCRGDVSSKDCSLCIQGSAKKIRQECPNQAHARIWDDNCFLRYNNESFFGKVDTSLGIYYYNVQNVTDPDRFNRELGSLMDKIKSEAVMTKNKGLGKGTKVLSPFLTLYALVQCTRDLSMLDCAQCLAIAVGNFPNFCNNKKGCRVLYSSCYVRYELYPFFFPAKSNKTLVDTTMLVVYP